VCIAAAAGGFVLGGCGESGEREAGEPIECASIAVAASPPAGLRLPAPSATFDYQLGGAYAVPAGVSVVSRDRDEAPAVGVYNVCYVNAFQTQPGSDWSGEREALVLHDAQGRRVADPDWPDEYLLDLSTEEKRGPLAVIVGEWIARCAADGFDAVELDNLDSFTRSRGRFHFADTSAFAVELIEAAHRSVLAVAQKNTAEASGCLHALGFDFAVAEDCWSEDECDSYTAEYGERVFDVEYDANAFDAGCRAARAPAPLHRDRDLVPPGPGYVREQCP
jgi:hypothetical protein